MTTFIGLPDLHDQAEALKRIARPLAKADVVLLVGDMTNGSMNHLLRLFSILNEFNEHVYAVPGNMDTPQVLAHLAREGMNLHRRFEMVDGVAVVGVGGALPFDGDFVFSEDEFSAMLDEAAAGLPSGMPVLLVSHQPPYNTALDVIRSGQHVGSRAVRAWIEKHQPLACVCGHIHEAAGVDRIGQTLLINPGPLAATWSYAYLDICDGQLVTAEIRRADADDGQDTPHER